jgi:diguanylate cyclase (GGDEF)-like protein
MPRLVCRRQVEAVIEEPIKLARAGRYGTRLAIAMIDIDHFKRVNDSIGHGAGDEVLREVVLRASEALRPYDGFGRVGGEEFLAIIAQVSASQVSRALERVRLAVHSTPIIAAGHEVSMTVSIGAALSRGESIDELIRSADEALYRAKAEGRDRVVMSTDGRQERDPEDAATCSGLT